VFDSLLCITWVDFCILCDSSAFLSAGVCLVLVEAAVVFIFLSVTQSIIGIQ